MSVFDAGLIFLCNGFKRLYMCWGKMVLGKEKPHSYIFVMESNLKMKNFLSSGRACLCLYEKFNCEFKIN